MPTSFVGNAHHMECYCILFYAFIAINNFTYYMYTRHVQDRVLGFKLKLKIWASPNSRSRFATVSTQDQVQDLASPNSRSSSRFGFFISKIKNKINISIYVFPCSIHVWKLCILVQGVSAEPATPCNWPLLSRLTCGR